MPSRSRTSSAASIGRYAWPSLASGSACRPRSRRFAEQREPRAVPEQDPDQVPPAADEHEQVARQRVLLQHVIHDQREGVERLGQVDGLGRHEHADRRRQAQHGPRPAARNTSATHTAAGTRSTWPLGHTTSIDPETTGAGRHCTATSTSHGSVLGSRRSRSRQQIDPLWADVLLPTPGAERHPAALQRGELAPRFVLRPRTHSHGHLQVPCHPAPQFRPDGDRGGGYETTLSASSRGTAHRQASSAWTAPRSTNVVTAARRGADSAA